VEHEQLLSTISQVAITLAALSGVAGVLGTRTGGSPLDEATRVLLRDVAAIGLVATLLSLLPPLFERTPAEGFVWRLLSGLAAAYWVLALRHAVPRLVGLLSRRRSNFFLTGPAATLVGLFLFSWNVIAPDSASPNRYVGALLCLLCVAGTNFIIAVFQLSN
jgi:hypothetical protein